MNWPGESIDALHKALLSAYPRESALTRLLRTELGISLKRVAGGDNYRAVVFSLIEYLESEDKLGELLSAALRNNANNKKLQALAERLQSGQLIDSLTLHYYECSNESYTLDLEEGVGLTMMLIPAGEFMMGSADDEADARDNERPQHKVQLTQFLLGATSVTQAQWRVVSGYGVVDTDLAADPSKFKGEDLPVENVSWYEAREFCKRLSQKTGKHFCLPSEAQWEYACRAGTETTYHFGPKITTGLANYNGEVGQTRAVSQYPPNRWGLYDMHGNVYEWCEDNFGSYESTPQDGTPWLTSNSDNHVRRGGTWSYLPRNCRSACRYYSNPDDRYHFIGFRVSCAAPRAIV